MIFEVILNAIKILLFTVLGFINLPSFPAEFENGIENILDLAFDNLGMLGLILPWSIITIGVPLLILIVNMDKLYKAMMWIIRKIPMLGIK